MSLAGEWRNQVIEKRLFIINTMQMMLMMMLMMMLIMMMITMRMPAPVEHCLDFGLWQNWRVAFLKRLLVVVHLRMTITTM